MEAIELDKKCKETVCDYFDNKNIFITGGTGFLGTVLIEALLRTSPNIGNIYVLIRDKNGFEANSRINKLLSKPVSIFFAFKFVSHCFCYFNSTLPSFLLLRTNITIKQCKCETSET